MNFYHVISPRILGTILTLRELIREPIQTKHQE